MLKGWGFSSAFDNIFTANAYIGNVEEKGVSFFTSHVGVILSPMSWYHNTDVWTFLKLMITIEHTKMMNDANALPWDMVNASFLASAS